MDIRLALHDPKRHGAWAEVTVEAARGTPFSAVHDRLVAALGLPPTLPQRPFRCNGEPVDASHLLGLPPLLQGAVLTLSNDLNRSEPHRAPAELEAHVIAGPDAGLVVPLALGRHRIGRGADCTVQLTDPQASRRHAELAVSTGGIGVRDARSANGTWIGNRPLGKGFEPLNPDQRFRVGANLIVLRPPERSRAGLTLDGAGHLLVNRRPQLRPGRVPVEISFPTPPSEPPRNQLPWPTLLIPLLLAVPLAVIWKQPTFLLFGLMTPLMMGGQHLFDRRTRRRELTVRRELHQQINERREQDLQRAIEADAEHLETTHPDLARLGTVPGPPGDGIWRRSTEEDEFLTLRLGRGPAPSQVTVRRPATEGSADRPGAETERIKHADVPVTIDLVAARVLGICGPRSAVLGTARALVGQIFTLHSPRDVAFQVCTAEPDQWMDWDWATLPAHYEDCLLAGLLDHSRIGLRRPVLLLDGAHRLRRRPDLATVLVQALSGPGRNRAESSPGPAEAAPLVICLEQNEVQLPLECGATVAVPGPSTSTSTSTSGSSTGSGLAVLQRKGQPAVHFLPDLAGSNWASRLARDLAPLRDATSEGDTELPVTVHLLELVAEADQVRPTDPVDLARHWQRRSRPEPTATLGVTRSGPFRVDLRQDGPHLLVGGTTGAGKSELLQTLVAALAVNSAPDLVSFLLIDYKGGAAFRECWDLPHVGEVITDLDPDLARRALTSLTAELRRRERLWQAAGSADIDGYHQARANDPDLPATPRLVVIVDEFRVLADELPEFIGGLIRTATVGRSLGVHLVLATQRPAGISADIRANANLRIGLRVSDSGESRDLLDNPAAAHLPVDRPGRALARSGGGASTEFQTAVVSRATTAVGERAPEVRRLGPAAVGDGGELTTSAALVPRLPPGSDVQSTAVLPSGPVVTSRTPRSGSGLSPSIESVPLVSDLAAISRAARAAAARLQVAAAIPPWTPPLPQSLCLEDVFHRFSTLSRRIASPSDPLWLPLGLLDLPAAQRQEVYAWALDGSHLAICGGPRSGRSTTLAAVARAAAAAEADVHVYVVDSAGALTSLRVLPKVEAVIGIQDTERAGRLLQLLSSEITARQLAPARSSSGPELVLLIDGWDGVTSGWNTVDHGRLIDELFTVLRDGPAVGVHAAISGGRSLLTGSVSALLTERILLRFADPSDAVLAGVPAAHVPRCPAPGRGLLLGRSFPEPVELQLGISAAGTVMSEAGPRGRTQTDETGGPRHRRSSPATRRTWQVPELPQRLEHHQLMSAWWARTVDEVPTGPNRKTFAGPDRRDLTEVDRKGLAELDRKDLPGLDHESLAELDRKDLPGLDHESLAELDRKDLPGLDHESLAELDRRDLAGLDHESLTGLGLEGLAGLGCCVPVGVGGDEVEALGLELDTSGVVLIIGPAGSGRTSTLRCLAEGLRLLEAPVVWVSLTGRPHAAAGTAATNSEVAGTVLIDGGQVHAPALLARVLAAEPSAVVLVDDTASPGRRLPRQDDLEDLLATQIGVRPLVIAAAGSEVLGAYRGLLGLARTSRSGLLLRPSDLGSAEVFGLRPEQRISGPPGRALLIQHGHPVNLQLALPPPSPSPSPASAPAPTPAGLSPSASSLPTPSSSPSPSSSLSAPSSSLSAPSSSLSAPSSSLPFSSAASSSPPSTTASSFTTSHPRPCVSPSLSGRQSPPSAPDPSPADPRPPPTPQFATAFSVAPGSPFATAFSVALSLCRSVALSLCRSVALPLCRSAALPLCRSAALPASGTHPPARSVSIPASPAELRIQVLVAQSSKWHDDEETFR